MSWSIPVKTDNMLKESKHAPSMQYAKDIYKVASTLDDFVALEIGAAWGLSTLAILEAGAKHLTSVDNNTMAQGENEAVANGYKDKFAWDCIRSEEFWKKNTTKFDLIYIDGSHDYKDVKNDLYKAWTFLKPGGLLLADDWDHRFNLTDYGVALACWEFVRDHPCEIGIEGRVLWLTEKT